VSTKRTYGDRCGIAHALDLVGERWALLIVRDLLLGPKRFTDLQTGLAGAGPNVLAQRLRELEAIGVLGRRTLPPPSGARVYELTEWGAQLGSVLTMLGRWGARAPVPPAPGSVISADSAMVKLCDGFQADEDRPWTAAYEIRLGHDSFALHVEDGRLAQAFRGQPRERPDAVIEASAAALDAILGGRQSAEDAQAEGELSLAGDGAAALRLFEAVCYSRRPAPAPLLPVG
jgi:DNA-binding HxlR family transcriptional regulator/putative sterol carrier protein